MKPNEATKGGRIVTIDGKLVTFKERFTLKENRDLPALMSACGKEDVSQSAQVAVMTRCIASWEFPGDPADPESYEDLDLFSEFLPLAKALAEYILAHMEAVNTDSKN